MVNRYILRRAPTGIIYMHWTDPGPHGQRGRSRRMSTRTANSKEAEKALARFLEAKSAGDAPVTKCPWCGALANKSSSEASRGDATAPRFQEAHNSNIVRGAKSTVAELWAVYTEKHVKIRTSAPGALEAAWKNLERHFGSLKVSDVSQDVVDRYQLKRERGLIGSRSVSATIRRELVAMRACFNWCARPNRKMLREEELPDFDLPDGGEPRDRWLTLDEVQALVTAAAELRLKSSQPERLSRAERFLWLAHETAARKTAICQLEWPRVDRETEVIDYNRPGMRRTKKRRAAVPISNALKPVLDRMHAERLPGCDLVMDTDKNVWKIIHTVAKHAGVAGVSPHVLRHTAATHMARRGVPIFTIAKVLAITVATAERVYAKHAPDDLREAVDKISEGFVRPGLSKIAEPKDEEDWQEIVDPDPST